MRAAYIHVLADAATSVMAIAALAGGYYFGLGFLDPSVRRWWARLSSRPGPMA